MGFKKSNGLKKVIVFTITACMIIGLLPMETCVMKQTETEAATFDDINQSSVFLKQSKGSVTCTLVSAAMLLRRAAMMNGNSNWSSITESSLKSTAWLNGQGLRHNFSYAGITVSHAADLGGSSEKLISLLNNHPEGIIIYNTSMPHAILVTDYTDGVFYCADPSPYYPSGRIPISQATFNVNTATKYWYVSSPDLDLSSSTPVTKATLGFDKTVFLCAGPITFYGKADGGNRGQVDIYKEGSYYKSLNLPPNSYVTEYFNKEGSYHAVYSVSDGTNTVTAEVQNFTVHNTYVSSPQNMNVGLEKNTFEKNENVTVYMFADYVTSYDLKICKDGNVLITEEIKAFHGCAPRNTYKIYKFSKAGTYTIYAKGKNMHGVSEEKECSFIILGDDADASTEPSMSPTPSSIPSEEPISSTIPSEEPSNSPTSSSVPSEEPSNSPTSSSVPSEEPSNSPTSSSVPSEEPSNNPTSSSIPSEEPSNSLTSSSVPSEGLGVTPPPSENVMKGDVNNDKQVTLADAQMVLKAALKISTLTDNELKAAEVNNDNMITLADAQLILKVALRIITFEENGI